ncbi:MAG TPA: M48 family metalloprotease [Terriglobia bacterium]|nr:M48 family metalloprotease [Terriglobia bacterium]
MKRWISLSTIFLCAGAALVYCEKRKVDSPVGPQAFLYFVGDTERELTRLPVSFTRLSDADEIRIGDSLAKEYAGHFGSNEKDPQARIIQTYVQKVGGRVASGAERKLPYKFHYIPEDGFINAFALPGGHVFLGKGLIALMTSEDELAAVLGHEIEHIDHYHCAERVQTEAALRKIPLGGLVGIPLEVFEAGYSKDQELEADREGAMLAAREGYSIQGALDMFETFDRLFREQIQRAKSPQQELSQVTVRALEDYFRSHPATPERMAQIRDLIASNPQSAATQVRSLEVAYIFDTDKAERVLAATQYQIAAGLVTTVLNQNPKYVPALRVQAEAQFALHNFSAAAEAYRNLLDLDPASTQQVVEFADKLASAALDKGDARLAAELATRVLDLQVNEPRAMKILVGASIEMGNDAVALATYRRIQNLYPSEATALLGGLDHAAVSAYGSGKFEEAVRLSTGTLALDSSHWVALRMRSNAQFALGHFAEAARDLRNLIEVKLANFLSIDSELSSLITDYADALGSGADANRGWVEFSPLAARLRSQPREIAMQAEIELAGLMLVGGNDSAAKELFARAHAQTAQAVAPEALARLGWWYYRAQNPSGGEMLLADLNRLRPEYGELLNYRGWTDLELHAPSSALTTFQLVPSDVKADDTLDNGPQMGLAIAKWRAGQREPALEAFHSAVDSKPEWLNPNWVGAIYSPGVTRSVGEMATEYQKRFSARRQP